jgi:hypothetical protein
MVEEIIIDTLNCQCVESIDEQILRRYSWFFIFLLFNLASDKNRRLCYNRPAVSSSLCCFLCLSFGNKSISKSEDVKFVESLLHRGGLVKSGKAFVVRLCFQVYFVWPLPCSSWVPPLQIVFRWKVEVILIVNKRLNLLSHQVPVLSLYQGNPLLVSQLTCDWIWAIVVFKEVHSIILISFLLFGFLSLIDCSIGFLYNFLHFVDRFPREKD